MKVSSIGIIGGGNMGTAILERVRSSYHVRVCEQDPIQVKRLQQQFGVIVDDLRTMISQVQVVIIAVKPQDIVPVLTILERMITSKHLIISIAAGITTEFLEQKLPPKTRVIRTMPNMPTMIGQGMTAICKGKKASKTDLSTAIEILSAVGETVVVTEKELDAVTAVSGSGPAYVFLFAECLMHAAQSLGLDQKLSRKLVMQTLQGSVHLLAQAQEDAAVLRARVTSKGGTTQAALAVFEKKKLRMIYQQALDAAAKRAKVLSQRA
jgi:pyrroline-5-carboxylate reductase